MNTVAEAIQALAAGEAVIVMDDEHRENEGDIVFAAQYASEKLVAWMVRYSSGVLCVPLTKKRAEKLHLAPMVANNQDPKGTAYTVSCDAAAGITTGISAADRAQSCQVLANPQAVPTDLTRPGHLFPLIAAEGLLHERQGHTEAALKLCQLARCEPAAVIAELVHDDGPMVSGQEVVDFARRHQCPVITIEALRSSL